MDGYFLRGVICVVMVLHWHSIGDSYLLGRRPRLMIWKINEFVDLMDVFMGLL